LGDAVIPDRVAGEVDRPAAWWNEHEADDIAGQRLDPGRPVPGGRRGDLQRSIAGLRKFWLLPGRQPLDGRAEPVGADPGGQDPLCFRQEFLAGMVEIVGVLVVTE